MKIYNLTKEERLEFFRTLYENAKNACSEEHSLYERHLNQYKGSKELDGARGVQVLSVISPMR